MVVVVWCIRGSEMGGLGRMGLFKDLPVNDSET